MVQETDLAEKNYLNKLYKDLYVKSAIDVDATIEIISCIEELACGVNAIKQNGVFLETPYLPGKTPMELISEFEKFWAASSNQLSLNNILELRNSLYRFQSI